ncbi:hypothetical protein, conserved in T. vivax [Trypanosoma vivax Y486]|uniref:Uncharacterized protein n=1 Tax=Trypanosoma vivax (strain Y486) TaxID=1055687 RepID=F9WUZ3_TRYVY|nr:hypothetical protein, conserved in T. vivax [Trypanosoma vivax Y486]|eukprot:CCD21393.1 hypothetical protein, conserved in T. vivax [Trypanosoma vivax Y486]
MLAYKLILCSTVFLLCPIVAFSIDDEGESAQFRTWVCKWEQKRTVLLYYIRVLIAKTARDAGALRQQRAAFFEAWSNAVSLRNLKNVAKKVKKATEAVDWATQCEGVMFMTLQTIIRALNTMRGHVSDKDGTAPSDCGLEPHQGRAADRNMTYVEVIEHIKSTERRLQELSMFAEESVRTFYGNYVNGVGLLNDTNNYFAAAEAARRALREADEAMKDASDRKELNEKRVQLGCEVEKGLFFMREIFLTLHSVSERVISRERALKAKVGELDEGPGACGMAHTMFRSTAYANLRASSAKDESSLAVVELSEFMGIKGHSTLHHELEYDDDFKISLTNCRDSELEQSLVFRFARGEENDNIYDFDRWRAAADELWNKVESHTHIISEKCTKVSGVDCSEAVGAVTMLIGRLRQLEGDLERGLGAAIRALKTVEDGIATSQDAMRKCQHGGAVNEHHTEAKEPQTTSGRREANTDSAPAKEQLDAASKLEGGSRLEEEVDGNEKEEQQEAPANGPQGALGVRQEETSYEGDAGRGSVDTGHDEFATYLASRSACSTAGDGIESSSTAGDAAAVEARSKKKYLALMSVLCFLFVSAASVVLLAWKRTKL